MLSACRQQVVRHGFRKNQYTFFSGFINLDGPPKIRDLVWEQSMRIEKLENDVQTLQCKVKELSKDPPPPSSMFAASKPSKLAVTSDHPPPKLGASW